MTTRSTTLFLTFVFVIFWIGFEKYDCTFIGGGGSGPNICNIAVVINRLDQTSVGAFDFGFLNRHTSYYKVTFFPSTCLQFVIAWWSSLFVLYEYFFDWNGFFFLFRPCTPGMKIMSTHAEDFSSEIKPANYRWSISSHGTTSPVLTLSSCQKI